MAQDSGVFGVVHDLTKNTNLPPVSVFSLLYQFFPTFFMLISIPKPILIQSKWFKRFRFNYFLHDFRMSLIIM